MKKLPVLLSALALALAVALPASATQYIVATGLNKDNTGNAVAVFDIASYSGDNASVVVSVMHFGNMPRDGGNLIIEAKDYDAFVQAEPQALPLIHPLLGAEEFLNRKQRYCLWLDGASPALIAKCPLVKERIEKCREMRLASKADSTRTASSTSRPPISCSIRRRCRI